VVAATFLELVATAEWFESPEIEGKTIVKAAMTTVLVEFLNRDWAWLRTHELWLAEVLTELIRHCGGNVHHGFLLLDSCYVFSSFWASFGVVTSPMISAVKV
jgi:hypothetical protein